MIDFQTGGEETRRKMPTAVAIWIWFCAYLNCAGWALSAIHELNATAYVIALLIWLVALFVWKKKTSANLSQCMSGKKFPRRFRKLFPAAYLILTIMAFLGGVIYAPTNYDALAYRIPRILHWLAAGQWHWIHTIFERVNDRSCGIEWVSAPFIALFKTDRFLFLINFVSFLLLPGLVFSVFMRLGVRRRAAWHWMWIAPTGYGFVLQAGSLANDLFGAVFALAAVNFALRAKKSQSARDFFASILAAAMMTSAKTSNLPLLLPWAIAILPSLKLISRRPVKTFAVCAIAIFASALPTMVLNQKYSGDWSGAGLANSQAKHTALLRAVVNTGLLAVGNFTPPIFPMAGVWDRAVTNLIPARVTARLGGVMLETGAASFPAKEMQMEDNAGLGFGVSMLLLAGFVATGLAGGKVKSTRQATWLICLRWSPVISLLAVITQSNLSGIVRILIPYYLLIAPLLLTGAGQEQLVRQAWWRGAALAVFLAVALLLVLSPARPLFPVGTLLTKLKQRAPHSQAIARAEEVYTVYALRNDGFAPMRNILPPDLKVLGMVTFDDPETSLWRPFGSRRVEHVCPDDTAASLRTRDVEYLLLQNETFVSTFQCPLTNWLQRMNAQVVQTVRLNLRISPGALDWNLVKLN